MIRPSATRLYREWRPTAYGVEQKHGIARTERDKDIERWAIEYTPQDWRDMSDRIERASAPAGPGLGPVPPGVVLCVCVSRIHASAWQKARESERV